MNACSPADSPAVPDWAELDAGIEAGATDWQFRAGEPAAVRVAGAMQFLPLPPVAPERLRGLVDSALGAPSSGRRDGTLRYRGDVFRCHAYSAGGTPCLALRRLPAAIPDLVRLGVPSAFRDAALAQNRGLVLVTGPTGSGKSTTVAAAVDYLSRLKPVVILTLEDPIEYPHASARALIRQMEKGRDFHHFADALGGALRIDPDVIVVGEMRDAETIAAALSAAETGHLVLATLHCGSAAGAVARIAGVFPPQDAAQVRAQLAQNLVAVLAQQLFWSTSNQGVAAYELLLATPAVRRLIGDPAQSCLLLANEIATGGRQGMVAMEQSLEDLRRRRLIR